MGVKPPQRLFTVTTQVVRRVDGSVSTVAASGQQVIERVIEKPVIREIEKIVKVDNPELLERFNATLRECAELRKRLQDPSHRTLAAPKVEATAQKIIEQIAAQDPKWLRPAIAAAGFVLGVLVGGVFL